MHLHKLIGIPSPENISDAEDTVRLREFCTKGMGARIIILLSDLHLVVSYTDMSKNFN